MDEFIEEKPRWKRRLGIAAGGVIVLVVILYFAGTSAAFLKAVILPKVGQQLNAEVTVDDASISPFSSVSLKNLRLKTTGTEPVVAVNEVRLRYGLMDIVRGRINVSEATIDGAVINIITETDGSSNLDPLLKKEKIETEPSTSKPNLDLKGVALKNATVRLTQKLKGGGANITEISALNVTLDQLKNGAGGKLSLSSDLRVSQGTNGSMSAKIAGAYEFAISAELAPQSVKGSTRLQVSQAGGAFKDAEGFAAIIEADVAPANLNLAGIRFEKNGQALGQIRAHGPVDIAKNEGTISLEFTGLDRNVLNLAGARAGFDFAGSTINSTNRLEISRKATFLALDGRLTGEKLGVIRGEKPTPPVDMDFQYRVSADLTAKTAALEKIAFAARHKGAEFLVAAVDRPLNLSWGESTYGLKDSTLRMAVTNLNLADWKAVLGTNGPAGVVNIGARILAQEDGRKLGLDINAGIADLTMRVGTNTIRQDRIEFTSKGTIEELQRIDLSEYLLQLRTDQQLTLQVKGAVRSDLEKGQYTVQATADGVLPKILEQWNIPGITSTVGGVRLNANLTGTRLGKQASGSAQVERFTGKVGEIELEDFQTSFEYNLEMNENTARIHHAGLTITQGFSRGGVISLNGSMDLGKKTGTATFKIVDVNQVAVAPVLKAALGQKKLASVSISSSGTAAFGPGTNSVTADLSVTNLVVKDPAGSLPASPLGLGLSLDVELRGKAVNLREMTVSLTPTERANNKLQVVANLDLETNKPAPGTVSVKSDGLDFSHYYDIFAAKSTNAAAKPAATAAASANPNQEPAAMQLPIRLLTSTIAIDRLFLREVAISNWASTAVISNNFLTVNPLKMSVNGAPVTGNVALNLGTPGYTYDVALKADRVPLEPFANSFATTNTGQYKGFLVADASIRGAGMTGANLQKHLQGQVSFSATNLDLQIAGPGLRRILVPISVVLRVPELLETPINWLDGQTKIGGGKIVVEKMGVESEAFYANVTGDILLDPVLTNSPLNLPVSLSLRKSLADKALLIGKKTASNAKYEPLPNFVVIKGTLGKPDPDIKELALTGVLLNTASGLTKNAIVGNAAAAVSALTGNSSSTNASGTNVGAGPKILQGLGNLFGGNKSTNTAGTNAPATNKPSLNPLNLFKKSN